MPQKKRLPPFLDTTDSRGLVVLMRVFLEWRRVHGAAPHSLTTCEQGLAPFIVFCQERGITKALDVTKPVIDRYQRSLFLYRKENDEPLSIRYQYTRLSFIRSFFSWLTRHNYILGNPASELDLPRLPQQLPPNVFTIEEAERVLNHPDVTTTLGLRDRAILELLYSTGIRRMEIRRLKIYDLDFTRGVLFVRQGKGRKDRVVPMGERAMAWLTKYASDSRPQIATEPDEGWLFLTNRGEPFSVEPMSCVARRHIIGSGVRSAGACHLFRHSMATLMLEGGADVRYVQQMLGHASLETTQIYTHVAITKLKEIHRATHPGAKLRPALTGAQDALAETPEGNGDEEPASGRHGGA
jgi:integrase/recombinase XerD